MKRVLVIGAGVGGIAAAARLARAGYQVTVLEKNGTPGGRCGRVDRDGHRFDVGATLFLLPPFFKDAFHALGENVEDHLDLTRVDPTYHLRFSDGTGLELTSDDERMREQLEAIEPGSYARFIAYMEEAARHYLGTVPRFVTKEYRSLYEFIHPSNLVSLWRLKALTSQHRNVCRYFKDERLRTAFSFQNVYVGLSPYAAPATFSLILHSEFSDGVWFPKGGMYTVVEALVSIAHKNGVRFLYDAPVSRINVHAGRATGVDLENGRTIDGDVIVANADLTYVYRHLLPFEHEHFERKKYGTSALTFLWGLDRNLPELAAHNLFFAEDVRDGYDGLFDGRGLPDQPHFYVHAPTRIDPSMAPKGGDTLMVAIPSGHRNPKHSQDWTSIQARARESVLSRLEKYGLADIRDRVKFEIARTPVDWERDYNLTMGSTHGLSHKVTQMSYLRPHNRHSRIRNLYFVGASTHPGTGVPNVLLSAAFAAQRILTEEGTSGPVPNGTPPAGEPVEIPTLGGL